MAIAIGKFYSSEEKLTDMIDVIAGVDGLAPFAELMRHTLGVALSEVEATGGLEVCVKKGLFKRVTSVACMAKVSGKKFSVEELAVQVKDFVGVIEGLLSVAAVMKGSGEIVAVTVGCISFRRL